jgi:flagellar FliJ protein
MARPFRLQTVLDISQDHVDGAARSLALLRGRIQEAEARLTLLRDYRVEYQGRMQTAMRSGMSVPMMREYQAFLARIDDGDRIQVREIERLQAQWQSAFEVWQAHYRKLSAYRVLKARHLAQEALRESKREQKLLDEFAQRQSSMLAAEESGW